MRWDATFREEIERDRNLLLMINIACLLCVSALSVCHVRSV